MHSRILTAGKPDATNNLLGMMVEQQEQEGFTDQEILHESAMFYAVRPISTKTDA